jgi:hypothetical protein
VSVAPLWCAAFLPFSDMPEQVAVVSTLRHWLDPAFRFQESYTLAFGKSQYLLYHVVAAALSVLTGGAETANLVLLTLVGLAFPYALRALCRALERDERLALFAIPAFWSRPLTMGFLPYVASVPAATYGLALVVRYARAPTRGRAAGLAAIAVALFYLHANAYVLFVGASIVLLVWLGAARRVLWLAPSAALAAAWTVWGSIANRASSLRDPGQVGFIRESEAVRQFPEWAHDIWRAHFDEACAVAVWGAFALLLLLSRRGGRRPLDAAAWIPLAAAVVLYFALPYRVGAGVMLNVRLAVFVVMFAPLVLRPARGALPRAALAAVACAGVVLSVGSAVEARAEDRDELGDIDRLLDRMPPGSRVLTLTFHVTSEYVHWAPWTFFGAYHRTRVGGVSSESFCELAHWPVRFRPGAAPPPKPSLFWTFDSCGYRNATDGPYYDYVLARGNVDPFRDAPPGPRWRRIDTEKDWVLYERDPGAANPAWPVADEGPCESRRSLERLQRPDVAPPRASASAFP